jgi:hypothetical protein
VIGATAMADKAAPGVAKMAHDPSAVVAVLGEIDRQDSGPTGPPSEHDK